MKTNLFYLHIMILMCAFNMQGSSSSAFNSAGAAAPASAAAGAAGLQMKTKYEASQAGQGVSMTALTPKALNSGSSSSAGAAAPANAAPVIAAPASAAAIAAGVAQAKKQEESVVKKSVDIVAAQAEYEGLIKQQKDLAEEHLKNIKKLNEERDEIAKEMGQYYEQQLAAITNRINGNEFNALIQEHKKKQDLARQPAKDKAKLILDQLNKMYLFPGTIEVRCQPLEPFRGAAHESVLTLYPRIQYRVPRYNLTNSRILINSKDIVTFDRKVTIGEPLGGRLALSACTPSEAYTPEEIIKLYNIQVGK